MTRASRDVTHCRACGSADLWRFLDLGATPLANALVRPEDAALEERRYPLAAVRCGGCGLVQLSVVVRPDILFGHYLYASSASAPLLGHFDAYAEEVARRFASPGALVVEVGSNDGVLLRPLRARGLAALGVEPSANLSRAANDAGLDTLNDFFGPAVAERIARERGRASAVLANNVLAHIDDVRGVARALDALLADDGVFVAEFPYLVDLLDHVEYDTIYHEHLSYLSLAPLTRLLALEGLEPFDVRRLPIHGGSLRLFVGRSGRRPPSAELERLRALEAAAGLDDPRTFERFAARVERSREVLVARLRSLRREGRTVAGLGATAKGNTLLNYCAIGTDLVAWIGDSTPLKQGLLTPGMHIPVRPEAAIVAERPDVTLLLAWNYADAILPRYEAYTRAGGRFIHPIPEARTIP